MIDRVIRKMVSTVYRVSSLMHVSQTMTRVSVRPGFKPLQPVSVSTRLIPKPGSSPPRQVRVFRVRGVHTYDQRPGPCRLRVDVDDL